MNKVTRVIIIAVILVAMLTGCNANTLQPVSENSGTSSSPESGDAEEQAPSEEADDNPYLSITYIKENENSSTGWDTVFYTYDINSKTLKEECIFPCDTGYASGVVSKYDNAVYYSANTVEGDFSANSLWKYDIATGESTIIDNENHSYNDILLVDRNTLLLMMITDKDQRPIMPVTFDLTSKEFTYMADVNDEPFIYTSGPTTPIYNYKTQEFACIYWNRSEDHGDNGYTSYETAIDHYLAATSKDLVKDKNRIFTHRAKINEMNMSAAVQLSENEFLVTMDNAPHSDVIEYYSLVFGEDETTFTKVDCPYPDSDYVINLYTIDGGKTFFFYLYGDRRGNPNGVYSYDTETDELTPVLLNDKATKGHYVNFCIVG